MKSELNIITTEKTVALSERFYNNHCELALDQYLTHRDGFQNMSNSETYSAAYPLVRFQKCVIDTFWTNLVESYGMTDYLMDDPDYIVSEVFKIYNDFMKDNPDAVVLSMVPIDLKGTFAIIVAQYPMTSN